MRAVFEEMNGEYGVFLVEERNQTYLLHESKMPKNIELMDVFKVEINAKNEINSLVQLTEEKRRRLEKNQSKRERLKRRKRK